MIKISSEEEAWRMLQTAISEGLGEKFEGIKFEGWPVVSVKLTGEAWKSSLTARNMQGLIELQNYLYKSLAILLYDDANPKRLSASEKERVTVSFKLSESSSLIEVNLEKAAEEIIKILAPHMSPELVATLVLGTFLICGGVSLFRLHLQQKKDLHMAKLSEESRQFAANEETKRMELFAKAIVREPKLGKLQDHSEEMYAKMIKGVSDAETVSLAGHDGITGTTLSTLSKGQRTKGVEERLDGNYRIQKVDSSDPDEFKVHLFHCESLEDFNATVQNDFVYTAKRNKEKLQSAEWERKEIFLKVNTRRVKGEVVSAVVLEIPENIEDET